MTITPQQFRARRERIHLSQSEIARKLKISQSSICKFETDVLNPTDDFIKKIVRFLEQKEREVFAIWRAQLEGQQ